MKKVVVTGAGGQLGQTLRDLSMDFPRIAARFFTKEELDITDADQVNAVFDEIRPEYCINCAAYTRVDEAERNPEAAMAVNALGAANLARACAENNAFMLQLSTDYVFDGRKKEGYTPQDTPSPINVYGRSKWEGEQEVQRQADRYLIVRTSWLYSRKYGPNFYLTIAGKAARGEPISVTDQQTGCPTLADHLSAYLWQVVEGDPPPSGIVHYTDGEAMTWYDFASRILSEIGKLEPGRLLRADNYRSFARRPRHSILLP
ncbi:dTDP-4-dehydrorhamnose reductase [Robiginitalea sediminis]|uniref:dTDP-4-dehydrorhamnose reductase n=1 Tax=Robiginitalea sediminis TaxID=1982593 RepID=UPI000B4B689D|nr:dTDP-4-dehydrorhamnose reductase [Robiginitalea sediminis]